MTSSDQTADAQGIGNNANPRVHFLWYCFFAVLIVLVYMCVRYRDGERSPVAVFDCLDSNVPNRAIFARSGMMFAPQDAVFEPLLCGVPRFTMPNEFFVPGLFYQWMRPFQAILLLELIARMVGLLGAVLLLRRYFLPRGSDFVVVGASLCFALLPFYNTVGLSVAGQPLLYWALANIGARDRSIWNWIVVGAFPFFSFLAVVGFFLIPGVGVFFLWKSISKRRVHFPLLTVTILLAAAYCLADYRLIGSVLFPGDYASHRIDAGGHHPARFTRALWYGYRNAIDGQIHVYSLQWPVMFVAFGLAWIPWVFHACTSKLLKKGTGSAEASDRSQEEQPRPGTGFFSRHAARLRAPPDDVPSAAEQRRAATRMLILFVACIAISLWYGLNLWTETGWVIDALGIKILSAFDLKRIHWLHPVLWCLVFALAVACISWMNRWGKVVAVLLIGSQLASVLHANFTNTATQPMSFQGFFSPPLFAEIREHIDRPVDSYRVASLGMHSSIALYNGFHTVDGFHYNYRLTHKQQFRKVIAGELEKDKRLRNHYDKWGSRCALFSSELGKNFVYTKDHETRRIEQWTCNMRALKQLGGDYIISAVEIGNAESLNLCLERVFEHEDSPWRIFLYRVPDQ